MSPNVYWCLDCPLTFVNRDEAIRHVEKRSHKVRLLDNFADWNRSYCAYHGLPFEPRVSG